MAGGLSESDGDFEDGDMLGEDGEGALQNGASAPAAPRQQIYNTDQLHDKLEDISWTEQAEWLETQVITSDSRPQIDNVEDDLTRELAFFNQVWGLSQPPSLALLDYEAFLEFSKPAIASCFQTA